MREHVKYQNNDILVEFIYFEYGQINFKRQIVDNQRNGWSFIYTKKGELVKNQTGEIAVFKTAINALNAALNYVKTKFDLQD